MFAPNYSPPSGETWEVFHSRGLYKLYAESFAGRAHLGRLQEQARAMIERAFAEGEAA
jgi:phosphoglucomutase